MSEDTEEKPVITVSVNNLTEIMRHAGELYGEAVKDMKLLEAQREELADMSGVTGRATNTFQRLLPGLVKVGSAIAAGGGVTALMADPGAFTGILRMLGG